MPSKCPRTIRRKVNKNFTQAEKKHAVVDPNQPQQEITKKKMNYNDEFQLSGDWRVALSEIIFPTKIENIVNGNLTVYNLKDYEDSQKMSSGANVISRPYSGQKLAFMPRTFDSVAQLLATVKRTVGLPHFSFRETKSSGKYEIFLGKYEGITFPSEEIPSIIGLKVFLTVIELILGTK